MAAEIDNIGTLIKEIRAGAQPHEIHHTPGRKTVLIPGHGDRAAVQINVDTETGLPTPLRKRGTVTVFDAASFNQILKDNADVANISIYFDRNPECPSVVAVMNGHGPKGPGWGDFRAEIQFRQTPQWKKWTALDGRMIQQVPFAEFIEENMEDIAPPPVDGDGPTAADMLELATYLTITRSVNFRAGVRLQGGTVQLQHDEFDDVKAGTVQVPETFTLGIRPIFGLASYMIPCRFRYRLNDRKLLLGFKIQRVETLMEKIVEDVISKIEKGANISVLDGLPPERLVG
jgi:uncharacterized protein YfdQ (DUF2303 family)